MSKRKRADSVASASKKQHVIPEDRAGMLPNEMWREIASCQYVARLLCLVCKTTGEAVKSLIKKPPRWWYWVGGYRNLWGALRRDDRIKTTIRIIVARDVWDSEEAIKFDAPLNGRTLGKPEDPLHAIARGAARRGHVTNLHRCSMMSPNVLNSTAIAMSACYGGHFRALNWLKAHNGRAGYNLAAVHAAGLAIERGRWTRAKAALGFISRPVSKGDCTTFERILEDAAKQSLRVEALELVQQEFPPDDCWVRRFPADLSTSPVNPVPALQWCLKRGCENHNPGFLRILIANTLGEMEHAWRWPILEWLETQPGVIDVLRTPEGDDTFYDDVFWGSPSQPPGPVHPDQWRQFEWLYRMGSPAGRGARDPLYDSILNHAATEEEAIAGMERLKALDMFRSFHVRSVVGDKVLHWLLLHGCRPSNQLMIHALTTGNKARVEMLHDNGGTWPPNGLEYARVSKDKAFVMWVLGFPDFIM